MKKLVLVAVFLLGFSVMAMAEDTPAIEIFGGYSLVIPDSYVALAQTDAQGMDFKLQGWNGQIAFNGSKWAGFVADFAGLYGSVGEDTQLEKNSADVRLHSFLFGPRVALHRGSVTPFVQALFGYARLSADYKGENVFKENDFAMALGGGLDVNLNSTVAIRPMQLDYFTTKTGLTGDFADHFRYSAGIVLKLGKR